MMMKGKTCPFVLETKGHCLICLRPPPYRTSGSEEAGKAEEDDGVPILPVESIQRIANYLKLDRSKIFKDLVAAFPADLLPILERSELKGVLCGGCSQLTGTISDVALQMEALQIRLDSLIKKLHDQMTTDNKDGLEEDFRREMMSSSEPKTLLHHGIVEELRKETLIKSSLLIAKTQPRIALKKGLNLRRIDLDKSVPPPPDSSLPAPPTVIAGASTKSKEPDPGPVIVSVQGGCCSNGGDRVASTSKSIHTSSQDQELEHHSDPVNMLETSIRSPPEFPPLPQDQVAKLADAEPSPALIKPRLLNVPAPPRHTIKIWTCPSCNCNKTFARKSQLLRHRRIEHLHIRFQCDLCPNQFKDLVNMKKHRERVHIQSTGTAQPQPPKKKPMSATSTSLHWTFGSPARRRRPPPPTSTTAIQPMGLDCSICKLTFGTIKERLEHHGTVHNQRKRFLCGLSPETFSFRSTAAQHQSTVHKIGVGRNQFRAQGHHNQADPLSLMETETPNGRSQLFRFGASSAMKSAGQTTAAVQTSSSSGIIMTSSTSSAEEAAIARPQSQSWNQAMNVQRNRTIEVIQIDCEDPSSSTTAQRDSSTTTNELLPFKCQHCVSQFGSLQGLRLHLTRVHDARAAERKFGCAACGKKFINKSCLITHLRSVHLKERHTCPLCSRSFTQPGIMKSHMRYNCPNRNP